MKLVSKIEEKNYQNQQMNVISPNMNVTFNQTVNLETTLDQLTPFTKALK